MRFRTSASDECVSRDAIMSARQNVSWDEIRPSAQQQRSAHETLTILWRRRWLIAGALLLSLLVGAIGIVLYGLRYTSEAIIQVNFDSDARTESAVRQPTVPMDPIALIDSAARLIRSRAAVSAVVDRLQLDRDRYFARESLGWRALSELRSAAGLSMARPSTRDLAIDALTRRMIVSVEPRSYVISIAITTNDPQKSAAIANALAEEYLNGEKARRLADARAISEHALAELASTYGVRHPSYVLEEAKISRLQRLEKTAASDRAEAPASPDARFLPAEAILIPSGPNVQLVLGFVVSLALASVVWTSLRLGSGQPARAAVAPTKRPTTTAQATRSALRKVAGPRLTLRRIVIAIALVGGILFLWSLVQASSSLFKSLAI